MALRTTNELFYELHARPRVVAGKHIPGIGLHPNYEDASVPQYAEIVADMKDVLAEVP